MNQTAPAPLDPLIAAGRSVGLDPVPTVALASAGVGYLFLGNRGLIVGPAVVGAIFAVVAAKILHRADASGMSW